MEILNTVFGQVRDASRHLNLIDKHLIDEILDALADETESAAEYILAGNEKDLARMKPDDPKYDRLKLTAKRIADIAADIRKLASMPSPLGRELSRTLCPNGMEIRKISVPFGVIGVIYEARPNVSFDVFSICLKSGNACILKGGHDAQCSNEAIIKVIHRVLRRYGLDTNTTILLPPDREATKQLLQATGYIDLIIPRGSKELINYVRSHSTVPVIETGAGICHTYFDTYGDTAKGNAIVTNAKTRRVSVCNALDCLLIDHSRTNDLPAICNRLAEHRVTIYADPESLASLKGHYPDDLLEPACPESFGTEFLDYKMAIKTVNGIDEAIAHITRYSSKHSETIISENPARVERFQKEIDAACVYGNVSTAFTDGGQFGFGAEIGISTQKLHARGPMGLSEMTSYKYVITGNGQIRQ